MGITDLFSDLLSTFVPVEAHADAPAEDDDTPSDEGSEGKEEGGEEEGGEEEPEEEEEEEEEEEPEDIKPKLEEGTHTIAQWVCFGGC